MSVALICFRHFYYLINTMLPEFSLLGLNIQSFHLFFVLSFLVSAIQLKKNLSKLIKKEMLYIWVTFLAFILGYLGSLLFSLIENIPSTFEFGDYSKYQIGKNYYGGLIIAGIGVFCFSKYLFKVSFSQILIAAIPPIFLGYAIGRLGCFFAGDGCYGVETNIIAGMSFPNGMHPIITPVHPTPLYESFFGLIYYFLFQFILFKRVRNQITILNYISLGFLLLSITRFIIEFIRRNPTYWGLSQAQWISLIIILSVIIFNLYFYYKYRQESI